MLNPIDGDLKGGEENVLRYQFDLYNSCRPDLPSLWYIHRMSTIALLQRNTILFAFYDIPHYMFGVLQRKSAFIPLHHASFPVSLGKPIKIAESYRILIHVFALSLSVSHITLAQSDSQVAKSTSIFNFLFFVGDWTLHI